MTGFPARKYDQINVSVRKISGLEGRAMGLWGAGKAAWDGEEWTSRGLFKGHSIRDMVPGVGLGTDNKERSPGFKFGQVSR